MLYGSQHQIDNISIPKERTILFRSWIYLKQTPLLTTEVPEIKEGDMSFRNAGAYCYSMASNYNSRYRPAEVLWMNGQGHLIRAHETFEDLLRNQIPLPVEATV
jgi:diaminopimelate decarboxylase